MARGWSQRFLVVVMGGLGAFGCTSGEVASSPPPSMAGEIDLTAIPPRSRQGLAISPVPIDTSYLSDDQVIQVGYGSYIVNAEGVCFGCHSSPAGFLAGGNPFFLTNPPGTLVVWSRNLTPDAMTGLRMTEAQFLQVMRTGVDLHGDPTKMLIVMPWLYFRWMSDGDLRAIYAYLGQIPAVSNAVPSDNKAGIPLPPSIPFPGSYNDGDVARALPTSDDPGNIQRGLAIAPQAVPAGLSGTTLRMYGKGSYIANAVMACTECHTNPDRREDGRINTGAHMTGGVVFKVPPPLEPVFHQVRSMSANLKGVAYGFFNEPDDSYSRFQSLINTLSHSDESPARPLGWPMVFVAMDLRNLLDEDLQSVYTYAKRGPSISGAADALRQNYARFCTADGDCNAGESCNPSTSECVGRACGVDSDCDTCQTCGAGTCQAPAPDSACIATSR